MNSVFDREMQFFPKSVERFLGNGCISKKGEKTAILVADFFDFGSKRRFGGGIVTILKHNYNSQEFETVRSIVENYKS